MAGHTTNINLEKPTYSEDADIAVINSNMDIIDGKMGAVGNTSVQAQLNTASTNITNLGKELCAVVAGKQSTTGAATGEYVIVRGSTISGISDGAYIAAKTIPANTNLDSSYFSSTGMTKGIANALNNKINDKANRIIIAENTNLDSLLVTGIYRSPTTISGVGTLTNCPLTAPFVMAVAGNETAGGTTVGVVQMIANSDGVFARRGTSSGMPSDWTGFAKKGDTTQVNALSAATNVSLNSGHGFIKIGRIVLVSFTVNISAEIGANENVVTGVPLAIGDNQPPIVGFKQAGGERGTVYLLRVVNNRLIANTAIPVGSYSFAGSYIAEAEA